MTEQEMLEELKNWDEEAWNMFKARNYEVINLTPAEDSDDRTPS